MGGMKQTITREELIALGASAYGLLARHWHCKENNDELYVGTAKN
jgi:hypothetical protein